jgi:hypothetical protein
VKMQVTWDYVQSQALVLVVLNLHVLVCESWLIKKVASV